jgi:hypothetical protein
VVNTPAADSLGVFPGAALSAASLQVSAPLPRSSRPPTEAEVTLLRNAIQRASLYPSLGSNLLRAVDAVLGEADAILAEAAEDVAPHAAAAATHPAVSFAAAPLATPQVQRTVRTGIPTLVRSSTAWKGKAAGLVLPGLDNTDTAADASAVLPPLQPLSPTLFLEEVVDHEEELS